MSNATKSRREELKAEWLNCLIGKCDDINDQAGSFRVDAVVKVPEPGEAYARVVVSVGDDTHILNGNFPGMGSFVPAIEADRLLDAIRKLVNVANI